MIVGKYGVEGRCLDGLEVWNDAWAGRDDCSVVDRDHDDNDGF